MKLKAIDHVVLTVRDIPTTIDFYCGLLGMTHVLFEGQYNALHFGNQKINLHPYRAEYLPHAEITVPGTGDLCLIAEGSIDDVIATLDAASHPIEFGPSEQTGATGQMTSVYIRDPDLNLIEIACYIS